SRQVSASSEEMAARVADVSDQAGLLASTAAEVRALLAQFRVDESGQWETPAVDPSVVARRRADDWQPADLPRIAGRRVG
ncbi:MAG: hypothetical protein AB7P40_09520, partial [Chloroflexota bacterium]